ncbi:MAG: EAL domain-containing protein [Gallionella sp.]|nr:EAL domain-containing protein [Gallionella sp.]
MTEIKGIAEENCPLSSNKFPLLRRLSAVSLVVMLVTAGILIFLYRAERLAEHTLSAEQRNKQTASYLVQLLDEKIAGLLSSRHEQNAQTLKINPDIPLFTAALKQIRTNNFAKLKIYDLSGVTRYSSVQDDIGKSSDRPELLARALSGETIHQIDFHASFHSRYGELHGVHVSRIYMPLIQAGKRMGVIELDDDVTSIFKQFHYSTLWIALIIFTAFAALYAALFFAVSRIDRAVGKWQKNIADSEAALKESQNIAGLGSYVLNVRSGLWKSSEVLDQLFGIDAAYEHTIKGWERLIHPDDRAMVVDYFHNDVIAQGQAFDKQFRIIRPNDQAERWFHALGKLQFDARGRTVKMHGTIQDITRRKLAEDAWRVAAVAFETNEAILITDARSTIVRVNRAFSEITGYSAEEVLGKNPRIMHSGRQSKYFYVVMWQQLLHTGFWAGEIWDRRKNGEIYPKWMTITAVKNQQQETTNYVAIFSDITERKKTEGEIFNLAFYDALTKLPNRRLFLDRLRAALAASVRHHDYGAILFIDMDRFKALNDTLGHEYGDLLLVEVGLRIKACVREMDTVARYGGDEFVVLIDALSDDSDAVTRRVSLVAEKIRAALELPYKLKGHEHHSSPSIGISLYRGQEESPERLIEHADMAMYQVKKSGRNGVRFFDPVMQHDMATHDTLVNDLHHALALHQLQLHYQVQVDKENRPVGAEVFLRWRHPEHGVIMPAQFIPVAEESSLIIDIDRWVLGAVCQQLAAWGKYDRTRDLTLTVNISAKLFAQPDFVNEIAVMLRAHQAEPTRLKLELSERLVLTDVNTSMAKIQALKNLGVRLSMDNFGTVYSSLSYLKQLSPDQLKIHRDFIQGIGMEGNDALLVKTVANLAKSLELSVFAEGVETEEQRILLDSYNCDSYQGYLFGKPVSIEEFEVMLERL